MRFKPEKREPREVVKPPPEALGRVDGGGPWGPTQFDLPHRSGNTRAIVWVVGSCLTVLLIIATLWTLVYLQLT